MFDYFNNFNNLTASVFINDDEGGLHKDFENFLEKIAPEKPHDQYHHNGYEDNADAHIKRSIMGREVVVAVTEGKLDFGPWEQIFYPIATIATPIALCESDSRKIKNFGSLLFYQSGR